MSLREPADPARAGPLGSRRADVATFRPVAGHDGVETMEAFYLRQRFRPHAHEGYVLGLIERGVHSVWCRGVRHDVLGGTLARFNPGEVHHGGAGAAEGWVQRMIYVSEAAMRDLAEDIADRNRATAPDLGQVFRCDPPAAAAFARAHRTIQVADAALAREAALSDLVAAALARRSGALQPRAPRDAAPAAVRLMRDYLHAHVADDVPLARLAAVGGFRQRHAIDLFKRHLGLPPHAYHLQLKVAAVRRMLTAGLAPADCAAAAGFADQSHMTRHFRAVVGTTPGAFVVPP